MTRELPDVLARALCDARQRLGITQATVASLVGVSPTTVSLWEAGERVPSGPACRALVAVLDLSAEVEARLMALAGPRPRSR